MSDETVAVWKNAWLPPSETFIVNQLTSMSRWQFTTMGFHNLDSGLMRADCAPYSSNVGGRMLRRGLGVRGKWSTYSRHLHTTDSKLIHAHFGSGGIHTLPLAKANGVPHVTTFHGADTHMYASRVPGTEHWYRHGLSTLFRQGDRLLAASQYLADRLISSGAPAHKIDVVYTGTTILPRAHSDKRVGIAFLGRLIEIKGAAELLKAVAMMRRVNARSIPISIAGDGPQRDKLQCLARDLGLACTFVGRLESDAVPDFLARHQIFCAPSIASPKGTREGFGMVYLEAALQELPVVAYASGGVRESVSHGLTGLLAEEGNLEQLSECLEQLLLNPHMAIEFGTRGRERVISQFSIGAQTNILETIYSNITR